MKHGSQVHGLKLCIMLLIIIGGGALIPRQPARVSAGVDPNLAPYAQNILNRFGQYKGQYWIGGQQEIHWSQAQKDEMTNKVVAATNPDQYPGLRGWDFPFGGGSAGDGQWVIDTIISDWNTHKILPTISQHWTPFASSQGTVHDDMFVAGDIDDLLNSGSTSTARNRYAAWRNNLASDLQQLENASVPVLWRPFHEAGGGWFWWDKDGGSSNYKRLWNDLWTFLVNTKGLHNLIFVWTPGNRSTTTDWYPGDTTVDIIGADIYDGSAPNWSAWYNFLGGFSSTRLRAISEGDYMMLPSALSSAPFAYFMTWHSSQFDVNSSSTINSVYNDNRTVARGRMSQFVGGSLGGGATPTSPGCTTCGPNLALGKPATASSQEGSSLTPSQAVDGNAATRWSSSYSDPQWLQVDLGATTTINRVVLRWEAAYGRSYQVQTSNDATSWTTLSSTTAGDGGVDDLSNLNGSGRYVRVYGTARGTSWGYSLWELEVYGAPSQPTNTATRTSTSVPPTATRTNTSAPTGATATRTPTRTTTAPSSGCGTSNVALNRPATASSSDDATNRPAARAVDGSTTTRWSSAYSDPQWLQLDLGSTQSLCRVVLRWEAAYGRGYQVQSSQDGTSWTTLYSTTTGDGGVDDLTGLSGSGRYVRIYGTARGTSWGYSLWELEVYAGSTSPASSATATRTSTASAPATATLVPPTSTSGPAPTAGSLYTGNATHFGELGNPYGGCGVPQSVLETQNFVALNVQNTPGDYTTYLTRPIPAAYAGQIGFFDNGRNCGRWVRVTIGDFCTGINDGQPGQPFCRGGSWVSDQYNGAVLDMLVTDSCQDGNAWCRDDAFHLDLATGSLNLFQKNGQPVGSMYPNAWGNRKVHWQFIEAPSYSGDIQIGFLQGSELYWTAIAITRLKHGIHGVEYYANGSWMRAAMNSDMGQSYIIAATAGQTNEFKIRVYDASDRLINNGRVYTFSLPASCGAKCTAPYTQVSYTTQ